MANGAVIWEGASVIDGAPIAAIATGIKGRVRNEKIGQMIQVWILRSDIAPQAAVHTGADSSICGACPHRGEIVDGRNVGRSCYVTVFQAPASVYRTFADGKYPRLDADSARLALAGRAVRLGAYGDPGAVPVAVWESLLSDAARGTGYTHQWRDADSRLSQWCMASADSPEEAQEAQAMGYRTFRVGTFAEKAARGEFLCPNVKIGAQCADCLACDGTRAPNKASVFIPVHGASNKVAAFEKRAGAH